MAMNQLVCLVTKESTSSQDKGQREGKLYPGLKDFGDRALDKDSQKNERLDEDVEAKDDEPTKSLEKEENSWTEKIAYNIDRMI
ncbi:hypothetical protein Tco_0887158 [Tanacetum coccineum]